MLFLLLSGCSPKPIDTKCQYYRNVYGQLYSRHDTPITTYIDSSVPQNLKSAIYRAAATINKVTRHPVIVLSEAVSSGNNTSVIYYMKEGLKTPESQAYTRVDWSTDRIIRANIYVNGKYKWYNENQSTGEYNFEAVMLHEFGHFLGLTHAENGVMYMYLAAYTDRVTLSANDIRNIQCAY